jgi:hypothetical protein
MKRPLVLALAAAATLFAATAANAARVDWSVGINVPPVGAVVGPAYVGYPAYVPPPVVYLPRPRVWLPPLPRLAWFGHGYERGYEHGHDQWHRDDRAGWRR